MKCPYCGNRLRKRGHPLLPVLVVGVETGEPDDNTCRLFALVGEEAIRLEQQRCFNFDWPSAFFQPQNCQTICQGAQ